MNCYKTTNMVVTCKVFLDIRRQKKDKTYPLKIRITVDRKTKEIPLSLYLLKEQWDFANNRIKPSHPNAKLISVRINQKMTEIQEKALKYENADHVFTADDLRTAAVRSTSTVSFYDFAQQEIENLNNAGRVGNAITYRTATNRLIKFTGKQQIRFENIDYRLLEDFNNHLLESGLKPNAIASYMREIRAIYNKALKTGIVEQKYDPFNKFKIKTTRTISRASHGLRFKMIGSTESVQGLCGKNVRNAWLNRMQLKTTTTPQYVNHITYSPSHVT